jgi:hypothetical protein
LVSSWREVTGFEMALGTSPAPKQRPWLLTAAGCANF